MDTDMHTGRTPYENEDSSNLLQAKDAKDCQQPEARGEAWSRSPQPWEGTNPANSLIGLPASTTVAIQFCSFSPPLCGTLVQQTNTGS